ncbi:MAG: hypothetical protein HOP15_07300 [Planctomycetes bacterium]|nr:hypothetical protein [Planctomycetota bacterium]
MLEVDRVRVRELGWARGGASDEQGVETAARIVSRRCRSMGRTVRLHVEAERGRIEVVAALDLRDLGLCEFLVVAEEASLVGLDIDLAAERQRLERWRAANPLAESFRRLEGPLQIVETR